MTISSWLCTNNTKNMFIKVVHPGGHVELHDRPVLASEIMLRNPKCIVAYPNVFRQPSAIVAPDTTLMLGQKYYVVPVRTIRKLQRLSFRYSPSPVHENPSQNPPKSEESDDHVEKKQGCFSDDNCQIMCLNISAMKIKGNSSNDGENSSTKSTSSLISSEAKALTRKKKRTNEDFISKGSPKRLSSSNIDNWQPNLECITEE